jgi:hypothetical protein
MGSGLRQQGRVMVSKSKLLAHSTMLACVWTFAAGVGIAAAGESQSEAAAKSEQPTQIAQFGIQVPTKDTTIRRGETVFDRDRPELEPLGIRLGTFVAFPSVAVREEYNDNIFATDTNEVDDFVTHVLPGVRIVSDWNNHELRFDADADVGRYNDNDREDFEDYTVRASGRLDVLRSTSISGSAAYRARHEQRSSPDDVAGIEPTLYDVQSANISGRHQFNRLNVTLGAGIDRYDFDDVATSTGAIINNDDRDRDTLNTSLRLGYELVPEYEAFLRGTYNVTDYDANLDDTGVNRDSDGYEFVAGIELDFGGLTFGDFFAGYRAQEYDSAVLKDSSGPVIGADVTWNASPLTTLIGTVSREIRESTQQDASGNNASGRFFTTLGMSAQHELLRNLLLGLDASVSEDDFQGISRTDDIYRIGLNATYLVHRSVTLSGGYNYLVRDSSVAAADFVENSFFVQVRLQY